MNDHDDHVDALLRKQFEGHVPDDGFSARVMQRLPSPRRRATWPLWTGVLVGAVASAGGLGSAPVLQTGWRDWMGSQLSVPAMALLFTVAGLSLLAGVWAAMEGAEQ